MEAMFLDENNHNKSHNGYFTIQGGYRVIMKLFSSGFRLLLLLCNASSWPSRWVLKTPWSGELSDNYSTLQLSMSIATMEEEVVGVSVRLNQAMRQRFLMHSCEIPEA